MCPWEQLHLVETEFTPYIQISTLKVLKKKKIITVRIGKNYKGSNCKYKQKIGPSYPEAEKSNREPSDNVLDGISVPA